MNQEALRTFCMGDYHGPCYAGCDIRANRVAPHRHRLEYFCVDCGVVTCRVVMRQDHEDHRNIQVQFMRESFAVLVTDIEDLVDLYRVYHYVRWSKYFVMLRRPPSYQVVQQHRSNADCCMECKRRLNRKRTNPPPSAVLHATPPSTPESGDESDSGESENDEEEEEEEEEEGGGDDAGAQERAHHGFMEEWCSLACKFEIK